MAEETLYDSDATRHFAAIKLGDDRIPDETTILNFRHQLELHGLAGAIFAQVNGQRRRQGHYARSRHAGGCDKHRRAIVDHEQGPGPRGVVYRKGNDWCFGMKAHIGVDADSSVTHSLETSTAKLHDRQVWDLLLHCEETAIWANNGYLSAAREAAFKAPGKVWPVMRKTPKSRDLHTIDARISRIIAMVRAQVQYPFHVIKLQFSHLKTRYRGLDKNRALLFTLFALGNLFLVRRSLTALGRVCLKQTKGPLRRPSKHESSLRTQVS